MSKSIRLLLIVNVFCCCGTDLFANPIEQNTENAMQIIERMESNMRGESSYQEMTMQTVRPRYTRELSLKVWTLGDDYSLIYITAPARDKGTAFLKRGNEMWNYVPNIDRTVKMPSSMMSQSWMGSDFSNDDLVRGVSLVDDYTHTQLQNQKIDERECFVIEMTPKPETPVVFEKVTYWISVEYYLPIKVENYDDQNVLVSKIYFKEIKKIGGRNIPTIVEMIPEEKKGHKTILTTHNADYSIRLNQIFFSIQNLIDVR